VIEDYLEGLRTGGTVESPGFFSISREEMLRKLAPRPFGALPWLLTAALAGGATYLRVLRLSGEVMLEFDGAAPASLNPDHPSDLVLGLHVAARQGVVYQGGPHRLSASRGRWDLRTGGPAVQHQVRLACPPGHDGLFYWLDRMRYVPIPVEFEGERWNPGTSPGDFLVKRTTERANLYLGRSLFGNPLAGLPNLILVLGGISVMREPGWPEAHVVVLQPTGLRRTLEGDDVVEDEAYVTLLAELHGTLQHMARELDQACEKLPPAMVRSLRWIANRYLTSES